MDNLKHIKKEEEKERKEKQYGTPPDGSQGRASFHTGSATQGGSNYGQGSMHLSGNSYKQGDVGGKGSNYENERNKLNKLRDDEASDENENKFDE